MFASRVTSTPSSVTAVSAASRGRRPCSARASPPARRTRRPSASGIDDDLAAWRRRSRPPRPDPAGSQGREDAGGADDRGDPVCPGEDRGVGGRRSAPRAGSRGAARAAASRSATATGPRPRRSAGAGRSSSSAGQARQQPRDPVRDVRTSAAAGRAGPDRRAPRASRPPRPRGRIAATPSSPFPDSADRSSTRRVPGDRGVRHEDRRLVLVAVGAHPLAIAPSARPGGRFAAARSRASSASTASGATRHRGHVRPPYVDPSPRAMPGAAADARQPDRGQPDAAS